MHDEESIGLRRTQLLALDATLEDVRRALLRGVRIRSEFSTEIRAVLTTVSEISQRVHHAHLPESAGRGRP
jgi:hypothetical protein